MALDRQSIEKKDFPIARRGYEPEAVDAHLARLSADVEALQRQLAQAPQTAPRQGGDSLALAASEQVRAIVEAAEASAADIERAAREDAERIRSEAQAAAAQSREDAIAQSREHVGNVHESTSLMLQRVDAMENELGALMESLRTGANRLNADLSLLQGNMGELYSAAGGEQPAAPAPAPPAPAPAAPGHDDGQDGREPAYESTAEAPERDEPEPEPVPEPAAAQPAASGGDADVEGARLVALNMALNGQSRAETDRYLSENFDLSDRAGLLDEVYATVEG